MDSSPQNNPMGLGLSQEGYCPQWPFIYHGETGKGKSKGEND